MSLAFHPVIFLELGKSMLALLASLDKPLLAGEALLVEPNAADAGALAWDCTHDGGLAGSGGGMLPLGLLTGGSGGGMLPLGLLTGGLGLLIGDFGLLIGGLEMWTGGLGV